MKEGYAHEFSMQIAREDGIGPDFEIAGGLRRDDGGWHASLVQRPAPHVIYNSQTVEVTAPTGSLALEGVGSAARQLGFNPRAEVVLRRLMEQANL